MKFSKSAMKFILSALEKCDKKHPIVPSYTYSPFHLDELISKVADAFKRIMIEKNNLTPAIACHWGPNAFGLIFVEQ